MTALRHVGLRTTAWTGLVVLLATGLIWMATAVEGAATRGLLDGLLAAPTVLTWLTPTLCAIGCALCHARMQARGEREALEVSGAGPWFTGRAPVILGLAVGLLAWATSGHISPALETRRGTFEGNWVWTSEGAIRPRDGVIVRGTAGEITVQREHHLAEDEVIQAAMRQQPRLASAKVLSGAQSPPLVHEAHARLARILACAGLALLAWLPLARRPAEQVGAVILLALTWQVVDLAGTAGAHGRFGPVFSAWAATVALWFGLSVAWWHQRR
jgi:lipopolysaccharide export LptBFGC system permease protein LptF